MLTLKLPFDANSKKGLVRQIENFDFKQQLESVQNDCIAYKNLLPRMINPNLR